MDYWIIKLQCLRKTVVYIENINFSDVQAQGVYIRARE